MKLIWSPKALHRAAEIIDYIANDRPGAAVDWIDGLEARLDALLEFPEQGRIVREWYDPSVRELLYAGHRIIYENSEDQLEILTIRHQREDPETLQSDRHST